MGENKAPDGKWVRMNHILTYLKRTKRKPKCKGPLLVLLAIFLTWRLKIFNVENLNFLLCFVLES